MKKALVGLAVVATLVALGLPVLRAARTPPPDGPAAAPAVELAATDLATARTQPLVRTLEVSGGLEALDTAMLKARIAAEVREVVAREGDTVRAGQVLVRLDDTEAAWRLRQAEDQVAVADAQRAIAERTLANNRELVAQGFISRNALQTAESNLAAADGTQRAARAAAELARKSVRDAVVTAPLAGQVSQRFVQPGERVGIDARLLEIVDLRRLELAAPLAPADAAQVRPGMRATLSVEGLGSPVRGRVARLNPSTEEGTRAVQVYLTVDPAPSLRRGLFARGTIELARRDARVVPVSAVRVDQGRPYVLTAEDGLIVSHLVTPGERGEAEFGGSREAAVEIADGLPEGAIVLRGTVGALRAGTPVKLP